MDYPQEENKRSNKILLVGGAVLAVLILAAIGFFVFRMLGKAPAASPAIEQNTNTVRGGGSVNVQPVNSNDNVPSVKNTPLPAGNGAYYDVPPGLNRPLTADEKIKYHFPADANVWIITTSPTDGSKPDVYFSQGQMQK